MTTRGAVRRSRPDPQLRSELRIVDAAGQDRVHRSFTGGLADGPTYGRTLRFERAAARLGRDDGSGFAEIAFECGYYDQAHLNRDFKGFAATTPGDYVGRLLPGGGVAAEVTSVQDGSLAAV